MKQTRGILFLAFLFVGGSRVWGQPGPTTVAVTAFSSSTGATLVATGPAGTSTTIDQAATIGGFPAWSVLGGITLDTNGRGQYQDTGAAAVPQRFYRLRNTPLWLNSQAVYSVNVAALTKRSVGTGLVLLSNPLLATNGTVDSGFKTPINGFSLFRLTPAGFEANNYFYGWTSPTMPFGPGEGFFLNNASGSGATLVFYGEVPLGTLTVSIPEGPSLLSSKVPQAGALESALGFPADYDAVYRWNTGSSSFDIYFHDPGTGWFPSEPNLGVSEGFWLETDSARNWTRTFFPNFAPQLTGSETQDAAGTSLPYFTLAGGSPVQVNFFTFNSGIGLGRVFDTDGTTPVGSAFVGQLFAGASNSEGSLAAVGSAVAFQSGQAAGLINSGLVSVPGISAGQGIYLQLRVWEGAKGATYAAAVANGSKAGKSAIFSVTAVTPPGNGPAVPPPSANGFTSFSLTAPPPVFPFAASLDGAQDGGGGRQGSGAVALSLSGTTLTLNGSFAGLSGTLNAGGAHIHGPAGAGSAASVLYSIYSLITLNPDQKSGTINGTVNLVAGTGGYDLPTQQGQLTNGLWYLNLHTATFGGGEIRGQILSVPEIPSILAQPRSQTNATGTNLTLSVVAGGTPPLFYQWYFNTTTKLTAATNASLSLTNLQLTNAGTYRVVVTNSAGAITSTIATVSVYPADDRDSDGMPNSWEVLYGFNPDSAFDASLDLDGDGMSNLEEYRADTNPMDPGSYFRLIYLAVLPDNSAQVSLVTRAGVYYTVLYTDALENPVWSSLGPAIAATDTSLALTDVAPVPRRRFYRAIAQRTLATPPVYAINTLGFANVNLTPGSNMLALPFVPLFPSVNAIFPIPPEGSCVVKSGGLEFTCYFDGAWDPTPVFLSRGEPFEFHNPLETDLTVTLVGEVGGEPVIVEQPTNTTAVVGASASFHVASVGRPGMSHQWFFNEELLDGEVNPSLVLPNLQLANAGQYSVMVFNGVGATTSRVATLTVQLAVPSLSLRVNGQLVTTNTLAVTNSALVSLQTSFANGPIFYTLNGGHPGAGALYSGPFLVNTSVVVRAIAYSADFSEAAEAGPLSISVGDSPLFSQQPQSLTVLSGQPALFSALALGSAPLAYQWFFNGNALNGATSSSFARGAAGLADAGSYWAVASNALGRATSAVAGLTVLLRPSVLTQPASTNVLAGQSATFCVSALGSAPLLFQWRRNGVNIPGATNACYTVAGVQATNAGAYSVVVGNGADAITSAEAVLGVAGVPSGPAPDNFANRFSLASGGGSIGVTNVGATREPGEPLHAGKAGSNSVWYSWTPPAAGIATVRTAGSAFDTLLAVYLGEDVAALSPVAANEDGGGALTSEVRFNVTNGVPYQIALDGFAGAQGRFLLSWSLETTAQTLPVITTQPLSQTVNAGAPAPFNVAATGAGLTYQWHFNGTRLTAATNASYTRSNVQPADVGYYAVAVTNSQGRGLFSDAAVLEIGPFANVRSADKVEDLLGGPAPFQPAVAGAASVAIGTLGTQILNTTNSTTSFRETNHCGVIGGSSRWFKLQPSANGQLAIDTFGSTFDTVLASYTGNPQLGGYPTTLIACNNDVDPGHGLRWSRILHPATNATDYLIAVDGASANAAGTVQLNWTLGLPPVIVSNPPASTPTVGEGDPLQLTTALTNGLPPPKLQWYLDGQPIIDATNATYTLSTAARQSGGVYTVVAYNPIGSITGVVANVTVEVPLELNLQPVPQNGRVHFRVSGVASQTFLLQGSTNLVHWQPLYTNSAAGAPVTFDDLSTTNRNRRYYRALPWP